MADRFDYFVILAGMRTGSNFLEASLNSYGGITCHGEVFNPAFVGHANQSQLFGMDVAAVAERPMDMLELLRGKTDGMAGFRLFKDHNSAVLDHVLRDPRCAKIMLRRNPIDSFVSLEIVQKTGQWRLADMKNAKSAKVQFDAAKFAAYLADLRGFQAHCTTRMQTGGQAAFVIDYEQLNDVDVLNGAVHFLGVKAQRDEVARATKKQNPEPLSDKVTNFAQMVQDVAALDPLSLMHDPSFEPARGAIVGQYEAAHAAAVLHLPIKAGPTGQVSQWLHGVGGGQAPITGFSQKALRQWKRQNPGHVSFAVVRHPLLRAFSAFVTHFVEPSDHHFAGIAATLASRYGLALPAVAPIDQVPDAALAAGFLDFLTFVKGNLGGQTSIRVDGAWASQTAIVEGLARFALPDHILREEHLAQDLAHLQGRLGVDGAAYRADNRLAARLAAIHDAQMEKAARAAYQKDYMMFGYGAWREQSAG